MNTRPAGADRKVTIALATALLWHGALLLSGSYRRTYDAYIHMFFGDHYARDWFSTWEPRWYTGFTVTSYPPGTHQLIGLLSPVFGLEGGFVIVQLGGIALLTVGVYRFSTIWVSKESAGWAAVASVVSTSIAEVVHVFGQLPTSVSLGLLLNALPSVYAWVAQGLRRHFVAGVAILAATTAAHHVTTLFGTVFFVAPVIATALIDRVRTPLQDEDAGRSTRLTAQTVLPVLAGRARRLMPPLIRAGIIGTTALAVLVTVVLPYWLWSSSDPIVQVPIPHATRDNFIENGAAGIVFFVVPWGLVIFALPFALARGAVSRAFPLAASAGLLFILGTGGTTPIPRLLLRGAFDILTLDRFTIWSTIAVLPLVGQLIASAVSGRLRRIGDAWAGPRLWQLGLAAVAGAAVLAAAGTANFARFRPLQPDRIDPAPIASFMEKDQHDRWRYLTLGFGDQMAIVSASTTAATVDGNYHSARRLPELTSRSVERLEGAKFRGVPGIGSLQQFLATPETYHLKFVFSNDSFYDPLLWASGWHQLERLANGVVVWEREDIPPLPFAQADRELPDWQRAMWGLLPMTAFASAGAAFLWLGSGLRMPGLAESIVATLARLMSATPGVAQTRRWLTRLDQRARALAQGAPRTAVRQTIFGQVRFRLSPLAELTYAPTRRHRRIAMIGLGSAALVVAVLAATALSAASPADPDDVVAEFYDDLDFRRVTDAWGRLDPQQRPTIDQFQLQRSVEDGLVASYAKLDRIETSVVARDGNRAVVATELTYLSALSEHRVERDHELIRRQGQWWIVPDPADVSTTPDTFFRRTEVSYLSQGRRQVTTERTSNADVLDRPRIAVLSTKVLEAEGRWSVIGEVANQDVDPADLTITARFLDDQGEVLAEHNAALGAILKVRPRETVPFRIDVQAIAGASEQTAEAAGDFHPDLFASPEIVADDVASVEIIAKAVVTGRDLQRSVELQNLSVVERASTPTLVGELRNGGVESATLPQVVVAIIGSDGTLSWVADQWINAGVRPQRVEPFVMPLAPPEGLRVVDVPLTIYGNAVANPETPATNTAPTMAVPAASTRPDMAKLRVHVHAFYRSRS